MFSDSKLTHDTDLSTLTEIVNSKRIYSGRNLGVYVSEQKNNYKNRVAAASNLAEDGGPLLSRYDFDGRRIYAMDPARRSKIIRNLSIERFFKTNAQLLHNFSDRNFVKNTFPTSENVYSDGDTDIVHSLWTPKNKFETFLELKKRDPPSLVKSLVNENKNKNMALIKPIPNPLEVIKDDEGSIRPSTRKKLVNDGGFQQILHPFMIL